MKYSAINVSNSFLQLQNASPSAALKTAVYASHPRCFDHKRKRFHNRREVHLKAKEKKRTELPT